jgi:A/G-specific adenine glycosylase
MTLTAPPGKRKTRSAGAACGGAIEGARLLAWYDRHRRDLPWRARPGEPRDPYRVWVSEIMLQQTTVGAVVPYYLRFIARFPTVKTLAAAELDEVLKYWAGLGYYARGRNLHACARTLVERYGGQFPRSAAELRALPGIGDYTAAAVAAIVFDVSVVPVDGNVERVVARLFAIDAALPRAKPVIRAAAARLVPQARAGDFAQALMDLGATICTPKTPACLHCPLCGNCLAQAGGAPESFPVKAAKRQGRLRRGAAFVVVRADESVLVRKRPAKGLLGGMTEVPTTDWAHDFDARSACDQAPTFADQAPMSGWRCLPGVVVHVFTHFPLELVVYLTEVPMQTTSPPGMRWVARADLAEEALPGVMRKVLAHAGLAAR